MQDSNNTRAKGILFTISCDSFSATLRRTMLDREYFQCASTIPVGAARGPVYAVIFPAVFFLFRSIDVARERRKFRVSRVPQHTRGRPKSRRSQVGPRGERTVNSFVN